MSDISRTPDLKQLDIPIDAWTKPFWEATAQHQLLLPACTACATVRWPPGPFCPRCQSQSVLWRPSGTGRIYSFTVVRSSEGDVQQWVQVPALIEFPEADGVRLLAAIVDAPVDAIEIGQSVEPDWVEAANAIVPVFRIKRR